jgi:hypothetical protein
MPYYDFMNSGVARWTVEGIRQKMGSSDVPPAAFAIFPNIFRNLRASGRSGFSTSNAGLRCRAAVILQRGFFRFRTSHRKRGKEFW